MKSSPGSSNDSEELQRIVDTSDDWAASIAALRESLAEEQAGRTMSLAEAVKRLAEKCR